VLAIQDAITGNHCWGCGTHRGDDRGGRRERQLVGVEALDVVAAPERGDPDLG
jgi:hypothetical protein